MNINKKYFILIILFTIKTCDLPKNRVLENIEEVSEYWRKHDALNLE